MARDHRGWRQPAPAGRRAGSTGVAVGLVEQDRGLRGAARPSGRSAASVQGLTEDAVAGRQVDQPEGSGDVCAGDGPRHEPVAACLPDRDEVVAVGVADGPDGRLERLVRVVRAVDGPDDGRGDGQVEVVALRIERIGASRPRMLARGPAPEARCGGRVDRSDDHPTSRSRRSRRLRRRRSRRRRGIAGGRPAGSAGRRVG